MTEKTNFDAQHAHKYFSTNCFNKTWEFMDKHGSLSSEEQMEMLHTALASLWHWSQREDVKPENLSVGHWQVSRVYCLLNQPQNARNYGLLSLHYAKDAPPFYKGYAYETLARAEMIAENRADMKEYLAKAYEMLEQVKDEENHQLLVKDLETIG